MKTLVATLLVVTCLAAVPPIAGSAAERRLESATLKQLSGLQHSKAMKLDAFPVGPTRSATVRFQRVAIYAADAEIYVESPTGRTKVPRSELIFLRGYSDDGSARVALALDSQLRVVRGGGDGPEGSFTLHASQQGNGVNLSAVTLEAALPPGFDFEFRCGNEAERIVSLTSSALPSVAAQLAQATQAASAGHALRFAIVAVDTDSSFMSKLFANNTSAATDYIASMFNTMNLMYERDLLVQLQIGTTILRTSAVGDPYAGFTPDATTAQLDTFSSYWKTNKGSVTRSFAILLSGVRESSDSGCDASGIAWIDAYCAKGTVFGADTVGSYSVNQVCTSLSNDQSDQLNARLVGHELGHNFGAYHTHCTDRTTGIAPVGTNTIDTCVSGESYNINNVETPCYSGPTSCPAAGAGTIMSYCNVTDSSGCATGTQDLLEFAPAHIGVINAAIALAPVGCLNKTDDVFFSGFE